MDPSAVELLDNVSKLGAHRHMIEDYISKKKLSKHGLHCSGADIEDGVLGSGGISTTMHGVLNKIMGPPLYQVDAGDKIRFSINRDAKVSTFTGDRFQRAEQESCIDIGDRKWKVHWTTDSPRADRMRNYRSDVLCDGNKAGSYLNEITDLIGVVAAGQIDKSTTCGIMLKKMEGVDVRHLMIKGVLYQMLITHLYTIKNEPVLVGKVDDTTYTIKRDYLLTSLQNSQGLLVNREVLNLETHTVLRLCAEQYPSIVMEGHDTKYTNIRLAKDDLKVVSYYRENGLDISYGAVLHPERWWDALLALACVLGGLEDLVYAYNFVLGWPDAYDIWHTEGRKFNGEYHLGIPKSRSVETMFADSAIRKMDTVSMGTNKLSGSNMIVLNRLAGNAIAGALLNIVDDFGFCDVDTYGDKLSASELGNGVKVDHAIHNMNRNNLYSRVIMELLGKVSVPIGSGFDNMIQQWAKTIHHSITGTGRWDTKVLKATHSCVFGRIKRGMGFGLLSNYDESMEFKQNDYNYTRDGHKSWVIAAWCVLNGYYSKGWLLTGPMIGSKGGSAPVVDVFDECRFTVPGKYLVTNWSITIGGVRGKRGTWKERNDKLEMDSYYTGAMDLIQESFRLPEDKILDKMVPEDAEEDRRRTTLRHQPKQIAVEIPVRAEFDRPVVEKIRESETPIIDEQEENFVIVQEGKTIKEILPDFGDTMPYTVRFGVGTSNDGKNHWCEFTGQGDAIKNVLISSEAYYLVERAKNGGDFKFKAIQTPLIRQKIRDIDSRMLDNVIMTAKQYTIPRKLEGSVNQSGREKL